MTREEVESSMISSIGYNAETETLEIEFQSGALYQYQEVPQDVYTELLSAESKGTYFNDNIRDQYPTIRKE